MTKATDHATASSTASGASPDVDVDAEHKPDVARRASRAGLEKHASSLTSASVEERSELRASSKQSNVDGFEAAIYLATKQVSDHCDRILALLQGPATAAGREPLRQEIQAAETTLGQHVTAIEGNIAISSSSGMATGPLRHVLALFERTYSRLSHLISAAVPLISVQEGGVPQVDPKIVAQLTSMYKRVGMELTPATGLIQRGDFAALHDSKESAVHAQAFETLLVAATESVKLARMSVAGVEENVREADFERATANVRQLALMLEITDDRTKHSHRAKLRAIAHDTRSLFAEELARPGKENRFKLMVERASVASNAVTEIQKAAK